MNCKTESRYRITWNDKRNRISAFFAYRDVAEEWYNEKLAEGKRPQFYKVKITTTLEAI